MADKKRREEPPRLATTDRNAVRSVNHEREGNARQPHLTAEEARFYAALSQDSTLGERRGGYKLILNVRSPCQ